MSCLIFLLGAYLFYVLVRYIIGKTNSGSSEFRRIIAKYRGRCSACGLAVAPGMQIDWSVKTKQVKHADCAPHVEQRHADWLESSLEKLERAAGPASRRNALDAALVQLPEGAQRTRLLLEASRIELSAVLDKIDGLKSAAAKRRHLVAALAAVRADEVPDELQAEEVAWLEDALKALDDA